MPPDKVQGQSPEENTGHGNKRIQGGGLVGLGEEQTFGAAFLLHGYILVARSVTRSIHVDCAACTEMSHKRQEVLKELLKV